MTCQDDLIEFREKMEILNRGRGKQIKYKNSKVTNDLIVHEEDL